MTGSAGARRLCGMLVATAFLLGAAPPTSIAREPLPAPLVVRSASADLNGWGVVGLDNRTSPAAGFKSNVLAFAEWQDRIYVGGMFTQVARNGTVVADQPFLAAFRRTTGRWISSFRPDLDGGVWDLVVTPGGKLVAGGYFAEVNGQPSPGLVALDPASGDRVPGWKASVAATSGRPGVRTLDMLGKWIYVGGNATSVTGGRGTTSTVTGKNVFRVRKSSGRPDPAFTPRTSTAPWQLYASRRGDRVYAAGKFGVVNGVSKEIAAVFDPADGSLIPGLREVRPSFDCRPNCGNPTYAPTSMAIYETRSGNRVVTTPTEHALQFLGRKTLKRKYGHITLHGGDYQAITESRGVVYAACHCFDNDYGGAWVYRGTSSPPPEYDQVHSINIVGAYDAATGQQIPSFQPDVVGSFGDGVWQLYADSAGCLWLGGDLTGTRSGDWRGGFSKHCP